MRLQSLSQEFPFEPPSCRQHPLFLETRYPINPYTMAATDLKALRFPFKDPKFIFFTDFDGTITLKDSNDFMVSLFFFKITTQQD
jgi:hypothetical protein